MKFLRHINIRSNVVLLSVAALCLGGFFIVENNKIKKKQNWYEEKLEAAKLSSYAALTLKNYYLGDAEFVSNINDPNETGLIGFEYSPITSERGSFTAKSSTTNPNYAALVVQLLKELDLKEGDYVAVGLTGSFPALNISVYAALKTLKLKPVIITSLASSSWGANDPEFTWLDMEKVLCDSGVFEFRSAMASAGASMDIGRGLSAEGVEMIWKAIKRNNIDSIYKKDFDANVAFRIETYKKLADGKPVKAYINVGGGIASIGSAKNGRSVSSGIHTEMTPGLFKDKKGVMYEMLRNKIPVIHLLDITKLNKDYGLPMKPIPLPEPGTGKLFEEKRYDLAIVIPITVFLLLVFIFIVYQDRKNVRLGKDVLRQESNSENEIIL